MAMKTTIPFSIFVPKSPSHRPTTELRFSRWNNANAEKFLRVERAQKEIEDDIRRERRYESASKIAYNDDVASTSTTVDNESFKSIGTPSSPSRPSIPGKSSKYSKSHNSNPNPKFSHPAFRRVSRVSKISKVPVEGTTGVSVGENGVSYRVPNAPFEFQYSYTETPKVKPLALREPPFLPFGPSTMPRPWTGRAPLPPSKKKLPEFDSFRLPPPHKKGVKPVQAPGPFIAGSGPRYVKSREEVLGEPLTNEEIKNLIQGCLKTRRQLNMGRDGLTHNMLDNIHAHWKRRRVCKIKCKGVCTVDMDNVFQQLEEKTGGKIIYSRGGVLFLFRGRNYNYRFRPRYPLMLWKPVTPVYPRLIQHAPEGLTLQEASEMRKKGRKLPPICKLGKNGMYSDLVKNVKEAFEVCELVRINCQGFNKSDYKKIGAKLKDLVPCVLVSFEHEHILLWRGRDWISSLPHLKDDCEEDLKKSDTDNETTTHPPDYSDSMTTTDQGTSELCARKNSSEDISFDASKIPVSSISGEGAILEETKDPLSLLLIEKNDVGSAVMNTHESEILLNNTGGESEGSSGIPGSTCTEGVLLLLKQAIENGSAVLLDDVFLDANIVYERAVSLAKVAPSGPVFRVRPRKVLVQKSEKQESEDSKVEVVPRLEMGGSKKKNSRIQKFKDLKNTYPETVPHGSLKVDELAKLLL